MSHFEACDSETLIYITVLKLPVQHPTADYIYELILDWSVIASSRSHERDGSL